MVTDLLYDQKFAYLMEQNATDIIKYLFDKNLEFGVVCDTAGVVFEPTLPKDIMKNIKQIALFVVSGYSFESAYLSDENTLFFEAGFGPNNFGATVGISVDKIAQIVIEDTPIFINISAGQKKKQEVIKDESDSEKRSMDRLLNNPENRRFLKK